MRTAGLAEVSLIDGVAIQGYATDRTVTYWNAASERLYKYSAAEAVGRKLEDLIIPPPARAAVIEEVGAWVAGGPPPTGGILHLQDKFGQSVPVQSNHLSIQDGERNRSLYCIDVPLDAQVSVESHLETAASAAPDASGGRGFQAQLMASMSHEVRTPLNAILGFSQMLAMNLPEGQRDARVADYLNHIEASGSQLLRVIEQSLALFASSHLAIDCQLTPTSVDDILVSVASLVLSESPGREDLIAFDLHPGATVMTDPFVLSNGLAALVRFLVDQRTGTAPVLVRSAMATGLAKRVLVSAEAPGPAIPDRLKVQLLGGEDIKTDPFLSNNQAAQFQLSILQRSCRALGAMLTLDRTEDGKNRILVQLPVA